MRATEHTNGITLPELNSEGLTAINIRNQSLEGYEFDMRQPTDIPTISKLDSTTGKRHIHISESVDQKFQDNMNHIRFSCKTIKPR